MRAKKLTQYIPAVTLAITMAATNAFGYSLSIIPEILGDADSVTMQGTAITPDGLYVAGTAGSRGFLYSVGAANSINVLGGGAQSTVANGIGYRTSGGNTELIVSGMSSGYPTEWMTTDGGATWGDKRRNANTALGSMGTANQLGSMLGSDVYYVSSSRNTQNQPIYLNYGSGPWVATMTYASKGLSGGARGTMNGVSAIGRAVGRRGSNSANYGAYVMDYAAGTPTSYFINTLHDGVGVAQPLGELWSVSQNGQAIFGRSFLTGTSGDYYSFKTTMAGFGASRAQGAVVQLPELAGTGGSVSRTVTYGASPDGVWAVGMDYLGTEKAALWWTGDNANPASWTVTDLTQFAIDNGMIDGWVRLTRAYSVGVAPNGDPVVTGVGAWSPDGGTTTYTRAFVMQIPEPSAVVLAGLGLCGLLVFRRRK